MLFRSESIEIVHGDTARIPFGMGTYGSRSIAVGGSAIIKAIDKIVAKGKKIAAHMLEAADADVVFEDGAFKVETGQRRRLLETLRWEAMVPPDAMLVVGASGDAGTTVGDALFRPRVGGGREWRLLAMRPLDPAVDPMFRDGDEGSGAIAAREMTGPGQTAP